MPVKKVSLLKYAACLLCAFVLTVVASVPSRAAQVTKLNQPPLSERWFGIFVDNERVGFYHQKITETADGYRMEGDGSVSLKVMGFSKEASAREIYQVSKMLNLRSFEIEQNINGTFTRLSGKAGGSLLRVRSESNGKSRERMFRFKGEIYPGPALNIYPLMQGVTAGKSYQVLTFDPEEVKVKEVKITVLGEEQTPDGQTGLKLRNDLYPFVSNDIWVDAQGNTILESVRDGLVMTRAEDSRTLGAFVGMLAINRKDLIHDFSLVRAEPPLKNQARLTGLSVEINGWNDSLALLQEGGQVVEKSGEGRIIVRTGSALPVQQQGGAVDSDAIREKYLKPADMIESAAPEMKVQARNLAEGKAGQTEIARALASWTADWLKDSRDDGGSALASMKSRSGNCQTHARLYTALARAAGIPTRFVSGLVSLEGKGFLYHSWAESWLDGRWVSVDPTYNQLPADPTHLKFFEGHTPADMTPLIAIIGRIGIKVLEAKY
ncbi:transglutaminase-like domain-containing protein [Pelobacter propionicus]|uniref:Transglutaminase domain protein n=1 Tax=Pelobacter propionicus (strain DSM 2379 / NBRC 103807 / OttBd1) TaxID=338966 RepID=A1AU13_PELPD|nr:transglutaminase domain protein [Pelobacter propionicus DSM 2379]